MLNKIGYADVNMNLRARTNRSLQVKNYTESTFQNAVTQNLNDLKRILKYNVNAGIKFFCINSNVIPLATNPVQTCDWTLWFKDALQEIGHYIAEYNIRIVMHPKNHSSLNHKKADVFSTLLADLEYHCAFLDALGLNNQHKIVCHIPEGIDDKSENIKQVVNYYNQLPEHIKQRVVLENDASCYTFEEVYLISQSCYVPIAFNYYHYLCNNVGALKLEKILSLVRSSWKPEDGSPIYHYSEQAPLKPIGVHANMISYNSFIQFYNLLGDTPADIMIEANAKNIATIKAVNCVKYYYNLNIDTDVSKEWARYQFTLMSYGNQYYSHIKDMVRNGCDIAEFYLIIERALSYNPMERAQEHTALYIWNMIKDYANTREKNHFFKLLERKEWSFANATLSKLCLKYKADYVINSYYFILL